MRDHPRQTIRTGPYCAACLRCMHTIRYGMVESRTYGVSRAQRSELETLRREGGMCQGGPALKRRLTMFTRL